jgi:hypothetical protein
MHVCRPQSLSATPLETINSDFSRRGRTPILRIVEIKRVQVCRSLDVWPLKVADHTDVHPIDFGVLPCRLSKSMHIKCVSCHVGIFKTAEYVNRTVP